MYDSHLSSDGYTQYGVDDLVEGKRKCKVRPATSACRPFRPACLQPSKPARMHTHPH